MTAAIAISTQRTTEDWRRIIADDLSRAVEGIIAAGRHLQEAKDEVKHGEWLPWLESMRWACRSIRSTFTVRSGLPNWVGPRWARRCPPKP